MLAQCQFHLDMGTEALAVLDRALKAYGTAAAGGTVPESACGFSQSDIIAWTARVLMKLQESQKALQLLTHVIQVRSVVMRMPGRC